MRTVTSISRLVSWKLVLISLSETALPRQTPCFPELAELPPASLEILAERVPGIAGDGREIVQVQVGNPGPGLAFFIRVRAVRSSDGEEILPVFWTDNYFSLLPGENKVLQADIAVGALPGLQIAVDGWNISAATHPIR